MNHKQTLAEQSRNHAKILAENKQAHEEAMEQQQRQHQDHVNSVSSAMEAIVADPAHFTQGISVPPPKKGGFISNLFGRKPKAEDLTKATLTREYNNFIRKAHQRIALKKDTTPDAINVRNKKIFEEADKAFVDRYGNIDTGHYAVDPDLAKHFKISRPVHEAIPRPPATNPHYLEVVHHGPFLTPVKSLNRHFTFNNNGDISSRGSSGEGGLYIARSR